MDLALTEAPDLILMDLMMPVMNGLEATRLIRQNPKSSSVPIVIVTAKITLQNNEGYDQSGCNDYISKPFTTKELGAKPGPVVLPASVLGDGRSWAGALFGGRSGRRSGDGHRVFL